MTDSQDGHQRPTAAIIGAGFGGICMAIKLKRYGIPFVILEKADRVGAFAAKHLPRRRLRHPVSPVQRPVRAQPRLVTHRRQAAEIQSYIEHCARKYGILEHVRFGAEVAGADFDEGTGRWTIRTADGQELQARFLVAATGQLSLPADPKFPGLESFPGEVFHSARWDHDYEMTGKRVAVIGSGASAIFRAADRAEGQQAVRVPALGPIRAAQARPGLHAVGEVHLPPLPRGPGRERTRKYLWQTRVIPLTRGRGISPIRRVALKNLQRQVSDPSLREKLLPDYPMGCKRILISNEWYPQSPAPTSRSSPAA